MQKNNNKQPRQRKKTDGKRISPTVSYTALDIVDKTGMTNSEFYEQSARAVALNNPHLIAKEEILKYKIADLEHEIKEIEEKAAADIKRKQAYIFKCQKELKDIKHKLNNYTPSESENAQKALAEAMALIREAREESKNKKWGINRVPLKKFEIIAKNNFIPLETLLAAINKDVINYWIE